MTGPPFPDAPWVLFLFGLSKGKDLITDLTCSLLQAGQGLGESGFNTQDPASCPGECSNIVSLPLLSLSS